MHRNNNHSTRTTLWFDFDTEVDHGKCDSCLEKLKLNNTGQKQMSSKQKYNKYKKKKQISLLSLHKNENSYNSLLWLPSQDPGNPYSFSSKEEAYV